MIRLDNRPLETLQISKNNPSNYGDNRFPFWQLSRCRSGNLLSDRSGRRALATPGRYSNIWNVRANDSRSSTFKLQSFPPANDEKNDITIPIHHDGNAIKQSGSLGYRGIVFNEASKDTAYPPYKDALSCSPTSKLQPSPSTNDEEIETPTSIHHGNDKIQSGFFGHRGPVYNEAPKDTAYPSYKDVLMSQRHATDRN